MERAFGKKYGEASGYLLKYRKVSLPFLNCTSDQVPKVFHEETETQRLGLIQEQSEYYEQIL